MSQITSALPKLANIIFKEYIILIIIKQIAITKKTCNNKNAYDAKSICDNYNI